MDQFQKKKQLVLVFHELTMEHLGKDVFLVPYYLGKELAVDVKICYPRRKNNVNLPSEYRGVKLEPFFCPNTKGLKYYYPLFAIIWILRHFKEIDMLMLFHFFYRTMLITSVFRLLNKKATLYVKLDIPDFVVNRVDLRIKSNKLLAYLYKKFINKVDFFSCETTEVLEVIKKSSIHKMMKNKLYLMPNGFDDIYLEEIGMNVLPYNKKENAVLTVGRLGSHQKNTEMFLEAIERLSSPMWQYYFIGNMEPSFEAYINEYFKRNPHLKECVHFLGNIQDKHTLWSYYNRSKVFVLTSRWESYGLVLNEAARFGDYIISTKVGAAPDILNETNFGRFIADNDVNELADILAGIQSEKFTYPDAVNVDLSWYSYVHKLIENAKNNNTFNGLC